MMHKICVYRLDAELCHKLETDKTKVIPCLSLLDVAYRLNKGEVSLFVGDFTILNEEETVASVCRLRERSSVPIMLIADTCCCAELLKAGADLCFPPGTSRLFLAAHAVALIRRCKIYNFDLQEESILVCGDLRLDSLRYRAWVDKEEINLQRREFKLLTYFVQNPGIVLTPERICETVWITESDYHRDVSSVISQLRKKLGDDPKRPIFIETVHGVGYRFLPAHEI